MNEDSLSGCLLGTAVGDALGLPCEALTPEKQRRYFGAIEGHRLFFGCGLYSDDTEHTIMVAQALIVSGGDVAAFEDSLARQLRVWILLIPGGVGLATLKACWKLVLGTGPERSGVFSAGNGPAMRSAIIGAFAGAANLPDEQLVALNRASARLTHTDPKAECGALAVALAARFAASENDMSPEAFFGYFKDKFSLQGAEADELRALMEKSRETRDKEQSTAEFCAAQGWTRGASGYVYHTVPAALHAWLKHPENFRDGVLEVIRCGGDTDSTAAIVGGLIGAHVGAKNIPQDWRSGLLEWPRGTAWLEKLAARLNEVSRTQIPQSSMETFWPGVLMRNLFFLIVVLGHGLRRMLPF